MLCCVSTTTQSVLNSFDWSCLPSQVSLIFFSVESIEEAQSALEYLEEREQTVALVIASHHAHFNGVDFLIGLDRMPHTEQARKILISCSSDIEAILTAVNEAGSTTASLNLCQITSYLTQCKKS